jgi:hypothetical protein
MTTTSPRFSTGAVMGKIIQPEGGGEKSCIPKQETEIN